MSKLIANISAALIIVFAASVTGLGIILNRLDPTSSPWNVALFYTVLGIMIFSFTFCIGFYSRRVFGIREHFRKHFIESVRQSVWFSILIVVALVLLSWGYFNWLNATFLVLALVFLESYFLFK